MNLIQELLNILERKENKKTLDLKKDWFEFGRTKASSVGNPLYSPKMTPHAIRYDDLKCNIISGLVEGTGTEHTLPMWSTVNASNCGVQTIVDSIFSQDAGATEGKVSGDFRVTGNTVLEGDLLVLGTQTIVESTIVEVADNIMRINSGGAGVDAGIEVIVPAGTKTWAWDNGDGVWSTFGESITTQDIKVNGAIKQDGETLINVVNEAEGLASQDNDESLATVAAIIDYFQTNDSYVDNVQIVGTDMIFTGVNNGFSGTLDLSSLLDNINLSRIVSGAMSGTDLILTRDDASTISIDLSSLAGTSYTAGAGLTLNGSTFDANVNPVVQVEASSPVTAVKGRVYAVQVNDRDELVVNVPWEDTEYSAGTYLSLSGSQFNHDNTSRINTTSTASPAAGATFTAIDSVTTNATGHVTGINTKTITLPEGGGAASSACVAGMWYAPDQTGTQFLTSTFSVIGNPTLGFQNTDGVTKHYAISWTIQYGMSGSTGIKFFETQMVQEIGGIPTVLTQSKWADSGYMVSEYSTTRTYTLYTNMAPGDIIYPQVKGSSDVVIKKAHIQVVETDCESTRNGSITVI